MPREEFSAQQKDCIRKKYFLWLFHSWKERVNRVSTSAHKTRDACLGESYKTRLGNKDSSSQNFPRIRPRWSTRGSKKLCVCVSHSNAIFNIFHFFFYSSENWIRRRSSVGWCLWISVNKLIIFNTHLYQNVCDQIMCVKFRLSKNVFKLFFSFFSPPSRKEERVEMCEFLCQKSQLVASDFYYG